MTDVQLTAALRSIRQAVAPRAAEPSDCQLLAAFAADNDQSAFTQIVRRHGPAVFGVCRRVLQHLQDAEDAFQATFLVLARKAGTVRRRESLAGWLHGVAYRVAMRAKRDAARRRKHERQTLAATSAPASRVVDWREVQAVLDEEVERLSPAYRDAFVLCCLSGLRQADAAHRLGVPEGTVSSRLTRARQRLQEALARRGITLTAVLTALALTGGAKAAVPVALADATARAAIQFARGAAHGLSAQVLTLAEGAMKTMLATKMKLVTVLLLLTLGLLGAGTAVVSQPVTAAKEPSTLQRAGTQAPTPSAEKAPEKAEPHAEPNPPKSYTCAGRVLDFGGKPVAGAKVHLLDASPPGQAPRACATTDVDGAFRFTFDQAEVERHYGYVNPWRAVFIVAVAKGHGLAFHQLEGPDKAKDCTLRLARDDVPVEGQVLDLEGRPLAGVTITVNSLGAPRGADLSAFVAAVQTNRSAYPPENDLLTTLYSRNLHHLFSEKTTDKDGRFTIKGVGRERVVGLTVSAPTIETRRVRVLTRPAEMLTVPAWKDNPGGDVFTYHGARFDHVAAPSSPIVGVVRDKDTGKPIPGAVVVSDKLAYSNISGRSDLRAVADEQGRYRLTGMPRGEGNVLRASPPEGQPYVMAEKDVPAGDGHKPVTVDFQLKRGVWITGKAIDKVTGKPVPGQVEYFAFADNPHLADYLRGHHRQEFTEDGTFRVVGLPGHGLLAFRAKGDGYLIGAGADKVKAKAERGHYPTRPHYCPADCYHAFVDLDPEKGAESVRCEVVLDPGKVVTGTLLGPDGKPLAGALARGLRSYGGIGYWEHEPLPGAEFTARGVTPDRPRALLFLHREKKLAGSLTLKGDEEGKPSVRLQPWGTLTGRVVDEDGQPRAGATLWLSGANRRPGDPGLDIGTHPQREFLTGKDGTFRIEGLVPGMKYRLFLLKGDRRWALASEVAAGPGETRNLGDVRAQPR